MYFIGIDSGSRWMDGKSVYSSLFSIGLSNEKKIAQNLWRFHLMM
jgi:hypothetical protein